MTEIKNNVNEGDSTSGKKQDDIVEELEIQAIKDISLESHNEWKEVKLPSNWKEISKDPELVIKWANDNYNTPLPTKLLKTPEIATNWLRKQQGNLITKGIEKFKATQVDESAQINQLRSTIEDLTETIKNKDSELKEVAIDLFMDTEKIREDKRDFAKGELKRKLSKDKIDLISIPFKDLHNTIKEIKDNNYFIVDQTSTNVNLKIESEGKNKTNFMENLYKSRQK